MNTKKEKDREVAAAAVVLINQTTKSEDEKCRR